MDDTPSGLLIFAIGFVTMLAFVLLLWAVNVLPGKLREIMSSAPAEPVRRSVPDPVHVPVPHTGTEAASAAPREVVLADTAAVNGGTGWEVPRVSSNMTDRDITIMLAVQKVGNKYRLSANQIHGLIGGSRKDVLDLVKEVRDGADVVFQPLDADRRPVMN